MKKRKILGQKHCHAVTKEITQNFFEKSKKGRKYENFF